MADDRCDVRGVMLPPNIQSSTTTPSHQQQTCSNVTYFTLLINLTWTDAPSCTAGRDPLLDPVIALQVINEPGRCAGIDRACGGEEPHCHAQPPRVDAPKHPLENASSLYGARPLTTIHAM